MLGPLMTGSLLECQEPWKHKRTARAHVLRQKAECEPPETQQITSRSHNTPDSVSLGPPDARHEPPSPLPAMFIQNVSFTISLL